MSAEAEFSISKSSGCLNPSERLVVCLRDSLRGCEWKAKSSRARGLELTKANEFLEDRGVSARCTLESVNGRSMVRKLLKKVESVLRELAKSGKPFRVVFSTRRREVERVTVTCSGAWLAHIVFVGDYKGNHCIVRAFDSAELGGRILANAGVAEGWRVIRVRSSSMAKLSHSRIRKALDDAAADGENYRVVFESAKLSWFQLESPEASAVRLLAESQKEKASAIALLVSATSPLPSASTAKVTADTSKSFTTDSLSDPISAITDSLSLSASISTLTLSVSSDALREPSKSAPPPERQPIVVGTFDVSTAPKRMIREPSELTLSDEEPEVISELKKMDELKTQLLALRMEQSSLRAKIVDTKNTLEPKRREVFGLARLLVGHLIASDSDQIAK